MSGVQVSTTVNGDVEEFVCHPGETLLDVLRNRLGLTGAKEGCGTGDCGACSVIVENVVAFEVAAALVDKFGGDSVEEMQARWTLYHDLARSR